MSDIKLTILGCGSSGGVPLVSCECKVCTSGNTKNNRLRCSAYISIGDELDLLIDTGPDLRYQALRENISNVDAVLYTHTHADHLNGIDDLRNFCFSKGVHKRIPLYGNSTTFAHIKHGFSYALGELTQMLDKPILTLHDVDNKCFYIRDTKIIPVPVHHGSWDTLGWRIGNLAWLSDVSSIPDSSNSLLKNLDVLLIDCLRYEPYPSHLSFAEACAVAKKLAAKRTILIHMSHSLGYDELKEKCPSGIEPAFDGMKINLSYE